MSADFDRRRIASAWALSIAGHAGLVAFGAALVASSLADRGPVALAKAGLDRDIAVDIELPTMIDPGLQAHGAASANDDAAELARGGGEGVPRPDTGARGRGGTDTADAAAMNLADRDDGTLLSPDVRSRLDRSQVARIQSSRDRASREDWRASREPMELTFLAMGSRGTRPERRTPAESDPSRGALALPDPGRLGSVLGAEALAPGFGAPPRQIGGGVLGGNRASAGIGVRDGVAGDDHRDSALVAHARPLVAEGTPSVPANQQGKPRDTVDSEQEVDRAVQSIVHASTAGGAPGVGPGGQSGPGATGSGGTSGPGSKANPLGTGRGGVLDVDPRDARRLEYMRIVRSRIGRHLSPDAFPKWAAVEGMQGTAIVTFVINADGSLGGASVSRSSGVREYDARCLEAVVQSAPFPALPLELGPKLRWAFPFEARNEAVRPPQPSRSE